MSSQTSWRTINYRSLLIREWEDGYTVFQPDSGKTHFLNSMAMRVLEKLNAIPEDNLSEGEVQADLVGQFGATISPEFVAGLDSTLSRLDELGLIECSASDGPRDH